jgi:hypothetical protein
MPYYQFDINFILYSMQLLGSLQQQEQQQIWLDPSVSSRVLSPQNAMPRQKFIK